MIRMLGDKDIWWPLTIHGEYFQAKPKGQQPELHTVMRLTNEQVGR